MVKRILLILLFLSTLTNADVYKTNCITCHKNLPVSIDKYFYRYLLKYSSEKDVKEAMINFMQEPSKEKSVMAEAFISRFGVKKKSLLSEKDLKSAINSYWEEYKVFGKLQ